MMLAKAINLNILNNNHLIVTLKEERIIDNILDIFLIALNQE